jgi:glycosyltransferase involved in cell wall biosynthesis
MHNLRQAAESAGISHLVRFTGKIPEREKNVELQQAHLLVHTSIREGWGLNVIEANAMGTPAVVYPVHGLMDSTVHGQTGLVATAETPQAVCTSILRLLNNPARYDEMRIRAWRRSKAFQWHNILPISCNWLEQQAKPSA